jgi:hypothetical protein
METFPRPYIQVAVVPGIGIMDKHSAMLEASVPVIETIYFRFVKMLDEQVGLYEETV